MTGNPADELVEAIDDEGNVVAVVTRREIREQHLLHRVSSVLVRNSAGEVYLHRRSMAKDIYPGAYDVWAGGVLSPGESPEDGARRELEEELGVSGVPLRPLFVERFEAERGRCITHCFEVLYDGEITHQPEEVMSGEWVPVDDLRARLRTARDTLTDDGALFLERWLDELG